ncbi:MAG: aminomethyl-transferring glycine dehydrogenase subunit GcvPB [Candidatus Omnitrophica bacterium]|nr:aminomethyl-transferring glycine dehydrogenase subunit GcvPB [Candidatus Omnitrophota bacterium]MDD5487787.1 aminomethyl-transferring glycine dehydrogenase subunit GcvPB [Candidatus Omnitrophota bacterium]
MELIFEKSRSGRKGVTLPANDTGLESGLPSRYLREKGAELPSVSEPEVVRHFTGLSKMNFGVDSHFYPLGSCTMKYNPKFTEKIASYEKFTSLHPLAPQLVTGAGLTQGALEVISRLEGLLSEITGMDAFTTHPMAGAHGELTGVMLIAAYHRHKGSRKKYVLIPDSGHGTNPASAAIAGYTVKSIPSDNRGSMDMARFAAELNDEVAAVMLTCPNTLGVFNRDIKKIADLTHKAGALMYYDGANLNAIMGKARPGDLGFDVVHLNLHKSFATPHGGGGPGSGPVGVKKELEPFLPISRVVKDKDGTYSLDYDKPLSIGYISPFYGNFGVMLKAYAYILLLGRQGLINVSENAVLNANYLMRHLSEKYDVPYADNCLHEFVISASRQAARGVRAIDIAKALIDKGIHPPTVYFPLIVKEAMMVEPTETESRDTLDQFIGVMMELALLAEKEPERFHAMPVTTPVGRLDEVKAARDMDIACLPLEQCSCAKA